MFLQNKRITKCYPPERLQISLFSLFGLLEELCLRDIVDHIRLHSETRDSRQNPLVFLQQILLSLSFRVAKVTKSREKDKGFDIRKCWADVVVVKKIFNWNYVIPKLKEIQVLNKMKNKRVHQSSQWDFPFGVTGRFLIILMPVEVGIHFIVIRLIRGHVFRVGVFLKFAFSICYHGKYLILIFLLEKRGMIFKRKHSLKERFFSFKSLDIDYAGNKFLKIFWKSK